MPFGENKVPDKRKVEPNPFPVEAVDSHNWREVLNWMHPPGNSQGSGRPLEFASSDDKDDYYDFQDCVKFGLNPYDFDPVQLMHLQEKAFQLYRVAKKFADAESEMEERRNRDSAYRLPCPTRWEKTQYFADLVDTPLRCYFEPIEPHIVRPAFQGVFRVVAAIAAARNPAPVPERIKKALQWKKKN
jgi:hypothetical protein